MQRNNIMSADEYINQLKMMYRSQFDLEEDKEIANKNFALYGFSHIKNKKYFATKEIKIWEYAQFEHCLIQKETSVSNKFAANNKTPTSDELLPEKNFLENTIKELVKPNMNHKQSYITLVKIVEKEIPGDLVEEIKDFSYSKTFALGFMGWCDIRLIVVNLANNQVFANTEGDKVKQNYLPERFSKAKTS